MFGKRVFMTEQVLFAAGFREHGSDLHHFCSYSEREDMKI